jgi:DNA-binding CsgD family transcriptional regulator
MSLLGRRDGGANIPITPDDAGAYGGAMTQEARLLERDVELEALVGRLAQLTAPGAGGVVLVEGVAGIGKSSLLRAFVAAARERPELTVLTARGTELELELAFGAVRHLFAPVVALDESERDRLLSGPAFLAAAVFGLRELPHGELADPLYALSWLVTNLAETAPVVMAIDDLHWLDAESGRFVAYLAQRVEGLPVLLAGTARPREPGAMATPLDTFRELAEVVSPRPLSEQAAATFVGDAADPAAAYRVTGGNPFLLAELLRALERAPGTSVEELQTRAVAQSVVRRVNRISPDAAALADAVALFTAGTALADAARVAGLEPAAAGRPADALIDAHVLVADGGRLEFLHPLMRSAVYEQLGAFARRQGHALAAEALKARAAPVEQVAAHLLAGEPAGDADNLRILRTAAAQSIAAVAPRAAVRYLERAVAEGAAEPAERRELLLELGRWQRITGQEAAQATLARALEDSMGTPAHVRSAIELAATAYSRADNRVVAETVRAVAGLEMTADERLILDMLHAEALWGEMQLDASLRMIDLVPRDLPGDTPAQRMALGMAGAARFLRGAPIDEVMDMLRRSVGQDGTAPGPVAGLDLGDPLQWIIQAGELDEAQALAEERMQHARATGDEALFAATQNAMGWVLALRGDLRGSEAAYRLGLGHPAASRFMRTHMVVNLVETLIALGELDAAEAELDALGESAFAHARHLIAIRRAEIARWRGDFAAALPAMEEDWRQNQIGGMEPNPQLVWLAGELVDCLAIVGRRDEALAIARPLVERSDALGLPFAMGVHRSALARLTGELADHERAVAALAGSPYRWHAARAQLEYGAALRRAGQRVEAREQLRLALDYCEASGAALLAERARNELRVSGARLRDVSELCGADALTPAEERIARLAGAGMSNKEIAQHLFVTVGTVQTTLVHVYRKLGIAGRTEIAAAIGGERPMAP